VFTLLQFHLAQFHFTSRVFLFFSYKSSFKTAPPSRQKERKNYNAFLFFHVLIFPLLICLARVLSSCSICFFTDSPCAPDGRACLGSCAAVFFAPVPTSLLEANPTFDACRGPRCKMKMREATTFSSISHPPLIRAGFRTLVMWSHFIFTHLAQTQLQIALGAGGEVVPNEAYLT